MPVSIGDGLSLIKHCKELWDDVNFNRSDMREFSRILTTQLVFIQEVQNESGAALQIAGNLSGWTDALDDLEE